jgi:hypothetical protein
MPPPQGLERNQLSGWKRKNSTSEITEEYISGTYGLIASHEDIEVEV